MTQARTRIARLGLQCGSESAGFKLLPGDELGAPDNLKSKSFPVTARTWILSETGASWHGVHLVTVRDDRDPARLRCCFPSTYSEVLSLFKFLMASRVRRRADGLRLEGQPGREALPAGPGCRAAGPAAADSDVMRQWARTVAPPPTHHDRRAVFQVPRRLADSDACHDG
jgi:hypothetical protein